MFVESIGQSAAPSAAELRHPDWRRESPADLKLRAWAGDQDEDWYAALADWLIERSTPEDRHRIMCRYDWAHGIAIPEWIIRQPNTQPATIYTILWRAEPDKMVPFLASGRPFPEDLSERLELVFDINKLLGHRFYRPPFLLRCIAFAGHEPLVWETRGPEYREAEARLIPEAAFRAIPGRHLDEAEDPIGCPVDLSLVR